MKISERKTLKTVLSCVAVACCIFSGCSEKSDPEEKVLPYAYVQAGNANMPSGGTITAEFADSPVGSDISKLVDNDPATEFVTYHDNFSIVWSGDASVAVASYSLVSAPGDRSGDPMSWTLSASDDNKVWIPLDTRKGETFSEGGEEKSFVLDNTDSYKYYMLQIKENAGGNSTCIAEWYLSVKEGEDVRYRITEIPEMKPFVERMSGSTYSDITPMGIYYENLHKTTSEDLEWLGDPATDSEIPVSAAEAGWTINNANWSKPMFSLYPAGNPRPADINQHGIGDCCLCAALAEMAYLYPEFIKSIITPYPGNSEAYYIAMFDPEGKPVTVAVTTSCLMDANGNIVALSGKDNVATWATLMEKAVMKWNVIYGANTSLGGIGTERVPPLFTGDGGSMAFSPGVLSVEELDEVVDILLEYGVLTVGGFTQGDVQIGDTPYKTVSAHAFSFMLSPDQEALFIMRNPWGGAAGAPEGDKSDGAMSIYDDGVVPPMIDLRVMEPGAAAPYLSYPQPYTPPMYSARSFWLSPEMCRQHNL